MKKQLKRYLAAAIALIMALPLSGVFASEIRYSEDFQNRAVYVPSENGWGHDSDNNVWGIRTGSGKEFIEGELRTSTVFGGGSWQSYYAIEKEQLYGNTWNKPEVWSEDNNLLCIKSNGGEIAVMNVIKNMGNFENGFTFSADVKNVFDGKLPPAAGIRLAKSTNEADYYELAMLGKESYTERGTTRFVKNTGAAAADITAADDSVFEYVSRGNEIENCLVSGESGLVTKWFNFKISVVRNLVSYKITDKKSNTVVWDGTYTDDENILQNGFIPQMIATGKNNWVYYDNISVTGISEEAEGGASDDFGGYTVGTSVSGKSAVLVENTWISSAAFGDTATYKIAKDETLCNNWGDNSETDNIILCLNGGTDKLAVINFAAESEGGYTLKADVRNYLLDGRINAANGIRLAKKGNESDYYELALTADETTWKGTAPRFTKVIGADKDTAGNKVAEAVKKLEEGTAALNTGHGDVEGWNGTLWHTAEITVKGKNVSWKVTDKNSGVTAWEGSFRDDEDLLTGGVTAQLFAYGTSKAFFDNVSFAPASSEAVKKSLILFSDDMESRPLYEATGNGLGADYDAHVPGVATGSGYTMFEGEWQTSPMYGGTSWATDYRVRYEKEHANSWNENDSDTTNKVISISTAGCNHAAINLIKNLSGTANGFIFSADARNYFNGDISESTGIRLVDRNNEANYYELALRADTTTVNSAGVNGVAMTPRFTKVTGADKNTTDKNTADSKFDYVAYGENVSNCELVLNNGFRTNKFTLSIAVNGNEISWSVKNLTTGIADWSGSHKFDEGIDASVLMPQLYTYTSKNDNALAYFDNVKVVKNGIALNKVNSSIMNIDAAFVNSSESAKIIIAYYDENGALVGAKTADAGIGIIYKENTAQIPSGAAAAKAFAVEGFETLAPITKADVCDL